MDKGVSINESSLEKALNRAIDRTILAHGDEVFIGEGYSGRESLLAYFAQEVAALASPLSAPPQEPTGAKLASLEQALRAKQAEALSAMRSTELDSDYNDGRASAYGDALVLVESIIYAPCQLCGKPQPCSVHGRTPASESDYQSLARDVEPTGASPQAETSEDEDDVPAVDSWSAPLRKPVAPKILSTDDFYALLRILEVLPVADPFLTDLQAKLSDEERRQHGNRASHLSGPEFVREIERIEALIQSRLPAPVLEPTVNRALREANDCLAAIRARLWEVLNGRDLGGDRSLLGMVNMLIGQRDEARENRRGEFELRMVAEAVEPTPEPPNQLASKVDAFMESALKLDRLSKVEPTPELEMCEWRYNADAERWQSGCDSQDLSGDERLVGPDEKAKFCPYCGKPLRLVPSEETPR